MSELQNLIYKNMSKQYDNIKLNNDQDFAYKSMVKGHNLFVTGSAGTGKSAVIKLFYNIFKNSKKISICSTTGISSILIGGTTLHSYLGIGIGKGSVYYLTQKIRKNAFLLKRWKELEILVIDEISMLSPELFDKLEEIARNLRKNDTPFGGIQLILTGDFLQLPCIDSEKFCFEAESWNKCIDNVINFKEIIRQRDEKFQECLNNIRVGNINEKVISILQSCLDKKLKNKDGIKPTRLCALNRNVDKINQKELDKLDTDIYEYEIELKCNYKTPDFVKDKITKSSLAQKNLQICVGAQVMLLCNLDLENKLANGSRGIIVDFVEDLPVVKFLNGQERIIDYHSWDLEEDKKKTTIEQIPLKLAYAISIHKSQGCSLDFVKLDLGNVFEYGQAYVALSRVKKLSGLSIKNVDLDRIVANPEALEYYNSL